MVLKAIVPLPGHHGGSRIANNEASVNQKGAEQIGVRGETTQVRAQGSSSAGAAQPPAISSADSG